MALFELMSSLSLDLAHQLLRGRIAALGHLPTIESARADSSRRCLVHLEVLDYQIGHLGFFIVAAIF